VQKGTDHFCSSGVTMPQEGVQKWSVPFCTLLQSPSRGSHSGAISLESPLVGQPWLPFCVFSARENRGTRHMTASNPALAAAAAGGNVMPTYGRQQIAFVRGEGNYLYDTEGKRYLDALAGVAVNALGHSHPGFIEALAQQLGTLI